MVNTFSIPVLTLIMLSPVIGAVVIALLPKDKSEVIKTVALASSLVALLLSFFVLAGYNRDLGGFQFTEQSTWIPSLGIGYHVAIDGFSAPMLLPVIVRLLLQSDPTLFKMGIVSVAYLVVMTFLAWRTHRTIKTILTLQHQNEDLVEHLESSNAKLSAEVLDRKTAQRTLGESVSVLQATLDATAEGILVLDFAGQLVSYNRRFLDMWKVPEELLDSKRAEILLHHLANQLREPEVFLARVRELYRTKSEEPRVRLEFNDGKIFERLSVPYSVDGAAVGRVWTFQVATERRGSTRV